MRRRLCGLITLVVWVGGYVYYIMAVVNRQTDPSLGYWVTITVVDYVMLAALLGAGVRGLPLMQIIIWVVGATVVTGLTLCYRTTFALSLSEQICLTLALVSVTLWWIQKEPRIAVVIQVIAMAVSSIPLWQNALLGREQWGPIAVCLAGSVTALGTLPTWAVREWPSLIVPVVAVCLNVTSTACAWHGRYRFPGT